MNEQELADLFSEQVDRLLQGDAPTSTSEADDFEALLNLGERLSQTQFQAAPAAQAAFQSQLASWFGLANGGSPMTILGLSKAWLISIFVAVAVVVTGAGIIAVIVARTIIIGPISALPDTPTPTELPTDTETPIATTTPMTGTIIITATPTLSGTLVITPTPTLTATPTITDLLTLIFQSQLYVVQLCQGTYSTQSTLVNYGTLPITDATLAWEVIEGADLVEDVSLVSNSLAPQNAESASTAASSLVSDSSAMALNYAPLDQVSVGQEVKLDVKVKVKDGWWGQPEGTKIKVKLKVKSSVEIGDHDRGHGNDDDGYDDDNPGHNQIITIVKQGGEWVTLTGFAHPYDDGSLLVDGNIVVINDCTGLPPTLPPDSGVQVIGIIQEDGTFVAITIIIIEGDVIIIDFDSGRGPETGGSSGGGGGGSGGCGGSGDHNRGHGNDCDGYDEDNPGGSKGGS